MTAESLIGRFAQATAPDGSTWRGQVTAFRPEPTVELTLEDGGRIIIPADWVVEDADLAAAAAAFVSVYGTAPTPGDHAWSTFLAGYLRAKAGVTPALAPEVEA